MKGVFEWLQAANVKMQTEKLPKISFIIPVYNGEKTLKRAVESILQTVNSRDVPSVEVIVVENGSEDGTPDVIQALQQQYGADMLRTFCSEKGVSFARNKGIEEARGHWLFFLDADDALMQGAVSILINDADVADTQLYAYGHLAGRERRPIIATRKIYLQDTAEQMKVKMIADPTKYMQAWGKLFKKEIILNNAIYFNTELSFAEDSDFTLQYLMHANQLCLCPEIVYHYSLNQNSVMRTFTGEKTQKYLDSLMSTQKIVDKASKSIKDAFQRYILMHLNIIMVREVFSANNPATYDDKFKQMKRIVQVPIFHHAIQSIKPWTCHSAKMMAILLLRLKQYRLASQVYALRARQNYKREEDKRRRSD